MDHKLSNMDDLPRIDKESLLPPRAYYRLPDAAKLLGCTVDDLIHYGATNRVEIVTPIQDDKVLAMPVNRTNGLEGVPFGTPELLVVPRKELQRIELFNEAECSSFSAGYEIWRARPIRSDPYQFITNEDAEQIEDSDSVWIFETRGNTTWERVSITITLESLFVMAEELYRFKSGLPMSAAQQSAIQAGMEKKPLAKKTENSLHAAVAALARLYTKTDCSKPYEAAETILKALEMEGVKAVKKDALASYIRAGNERLET